MEERHVEEEVFAWWWAQQCQLTTAGGGIVNRFSATTSGSCAGRPANRS